jgi:hypothetical protein
MAMLFRGAGKGGGELEVERGDRVPVQHDVKDRVTTTTRVKIPLLQAVLVALFLALDFGAGIIALWSLGELGSWLVAIVIGITSYVWLSIQAGRWRSGVVEALSDWTYPDDVWLLPMMRRIKGRDVFASGLYAVLGAGIVRCLWIVADRAMVGMPDEPGEWGWLAFLPFLFFSGVLVLTAISYVQQLVQYSPYMQQYGWAGFFRWAFEHRLTKREEPRAPVIVRGRPAVASQPTPRADEIPLEIEDVRYAVPQVGSPEWRAQITAEEMAAYELQEWLVRGATEPHPRSDNGAEPRGYGRNAWVGAILRCSGRRVSQVWWRETTRLLRDLNWMTSEPGGPTLLVDSLVDTLAGLRLPPAEGLPGRFAKDQQQRIAAARAEEPEAHVERMRRELAEMELTEIRERQSRKRG